MSQDPYYLPQSFYDFAFMPRFDDNIEHLAELAEPEDWDYKNTPSDKLKPILHNFIKYTYKRIAEEKKVAVSANEQYACWNTGLITPNQEPIYILFEKNRLDNATTYWHFSKFVRRGEWGLNNFSSLPEMAHYFEDPSCLVYNTRRELRANIEHIVEDNKNRFPSSFQGMPNYGLQNNIKGAVDSAIERVKRNYKTAIPQYYEGNIQLLLPLCLTDPTKADLALVLENFNDFYRASTCLTLDMAYNNARQITRPDREWLKP
ncbi:DUF3825 domain-containing protein [Nodularia sp. UHCC 0506]|uniref:DUF3825 domain-containing protein n=1 Tax=Nodularia sp. UHCC 0506 TaxID=3110243 RepID=UPI002B201A73|nr:DUF3825 domain-containing protein [Nodularia sp. UHCC 0506]MEA5514977.1 DUF3825 domain-containing protein [Nodularia sp. UHCC 0506]